MNKTQQLLHAARWYAPEFTWGAAPSGHIAGFKDGDMTIFFDLTDRATREAMITKLRLEEGWTIKPMKGYFLATRHKQGFGGIVESTEWQRHENLETLILQLIPGHEGPNV